MPSFRLSQIAVVVCALSLSARTVLYAAGLPQTDAEKPPKNRECPSTMQHLCDSVLHGYLDSLDYRIQALNDVAHRVDSLAQLFHLDHHWKLFMDGKKFGPVHIPPVKIPPQDFPELNVQIPEFTTPEINVPSIEIPQIQIDADSILPDMSLLPGGTIGGTVDLFGSKIFNFPGEVSIAPGMISVVPPTSEYYSDPDSGLHYFIRNRQPTQKATRVSPESNIWLLGTK